MRAIRCRWLVLGLAGLPAGLGAAEQSSPLFRLTETVPLTALPVNERGVTALVLAEGQLYGGTTGRAGHLFVFQPPGGAVRSLHRLPQGCGFSFGLVHLDGKLLAGTQADPTGLGGLPHPAGLGRLLEVALEGGEVEVRDRGAPVPGQGIRALAFSPSSGELVGLTFPDGRFFAHDLTSGESRDLGVLAGHRPFETDAPRQVARALAADSQGAVFTSGAEGRLHRYDPRSRTLSALPARLPSLPGREPWASLEAAVTVPGGAIYGGTSDGYLFRFDPRSGAVVNLGKPLRQGGFDGLVAAPSGALYAVAGERGGMPREVRYDPREGGFTLGGIPRVGGEASMEGFGALIHDGSGTVYAGERDRIARLAVYRIE